MALYEFYCLSCDSTSEKIYPITGETPVNILCPVCEEHTAKRIMSRNSFSLRGTGWYATSNRSSDYVTKSSTEEGE